MKKDDRVYVGHMLDLMRKAVDMLEGKSRKNFDTDEKTRLALAHLIQMIGEAANRVSHAGRSGYPDIPWKQIIGVRHRIVHDYMDVDYDVIWEIIRQDLPPLIRMLAEHIVKEEP